jgi:TonB family protein
MLCLWPSANKETAKAVVAGSAPSERSIRLLRTLILLLPAFSCVPGWSSVVRPLRVNPHRISLTQAERYLRRASAHVAELTPTMPTLALPTCESVQPPEALLTPDPPLPREPDALLVRVSFIIGSDGRVHSAFVLYSGGAEEDAAVLRAVHGWRYRPALCNGVPTDSEVRVRFGIRE